MGSVIGYDALCKRQDSLQDASRHSTPEHVHKKSDNGKHISFLNLYKF